MILGIDVDGVLADFNASFASRLARVTGHNRWTKGFEINVWDWPTALGYSAADIKRTWDDVIVDRTFWATLPPYLHTQKTMKLLRNAQNVCDIYFITARLGIDAKGQTERWIASFAPGGYGIEHPTVIVSSDKGWCARALKLDYYIDDRLENVENVRLESPDTTVQLFDQPWNRSREIPGVDRVTPTHPAFLGRDKPYFQMA